MPNCYIEYEYEDEKVFSFHFYFMFHFEQVLKSIIQSAIPFFNSTPAIPFDSQMGQKDRF